MKAMHILSTLVALALAVPAVAAPPRDWSRVATRRPDGAFVQGNPDARVKLVEYLSYSCPHCAVMEAQAIPPMTEKYVKPGLVSYEVRHALRDPFDFAAAVLARCEGPRGFFAVSPVVYAQQTTWMDKAAAWSEHAPTGLAPDKALAAAAEGAGLNALFAAHGLPPAKGAACLADPAERKLLTAMADAAWHRPDFPGTPDFLIDNVQADGIASWASLDQHLAAALKK